MLSTNMIHGLSKTSRVGLSHTSTNGLDRRTLHALRRRGLVLMIQATPKGGWTYRLSFRGMQLAKALKVLDKESCKVLAAY